MRSLFALLALVACVAGLSAAMPHPWSNRVVLIVNTSVPGSREIALYYCEARGVPVDNIVTIQTTATEVISRARFAEEVYNPVLRQLLQKGLLHGDLLNDVTVDGRERVKLLGSQIRYLVPVYGVPYKIAEDPKLKDPEQLVAFFQRYGAGANPPKFAGTPLDVNRASVDTELATMPLDGAPVSGLLPNPLYLQTSALGEGAEPLFRVVRLDGPSPETVVNLIQRSLEGERNGLLGWGAFDVDRRSGAYQMGNDWIRGAAEVTKQLGLPLVLDEGPGLLPIDTPMPPVAVYFGWYAEGVTGVFEQPGFSFAPGAIAAHLHSFSGQNLRKADTRWIGPLLQRGAAAVVGNTEEPFLRYTHNFQALMNALAQGACYGDAVWYAYPVLSWQGVAIGDPLYRPFAVSPAAQAEAVLSREASTWREGEALAVIRLITIQRQQGDAEEARDLARRLAKAYPHPGYVAELAQLARVADQSPKEARRLLKFVSDRSSFDRVGMGDWLGFARECTAADLEDEAMEAYDRALTGLSHRELRQMVLKQAIDAARGFKDKQRLARYETELAALQTPPPVE